MTEEKVYWQDKYIDEVEGMFVCLDERGEYIAQYDNIEEARERLDFYKTYILNNTSAS